MGNTVTGQPQNNWINLWRFALVCFLLVKFAGVQAEPLKLQSLDFTTLPGDNLQIDMALSGPAFTPKVFHTENPARIAMDLPGVANALEKKQIPVNVGGAESIQAIAATSRTRVVINLTQLSPYDIRAEGNHIIVVLRKGAMGLQQAAAKSAASRPVDDEALPVETNARSVKASGDSGILNIDFRRGEKGVGRLLITLANPKTIADIREEGRKVIANLPNTTLPAKFARRLDVMDFATPVQFIDAAEEGDGTRLVITPATDEYDYSSYQTNSQLTIEFRPLTRVEREEIKKKAFAYGGEKLSLNFQDIPVRSVLQILGDFTNLNIVASDTVQGNVTLRLNDVPWDQALDLVLKAKSLGKRQEGNIVQILPLDELNRQNKEDLEAQKVYEELEPLKTEIIQVNYTNAKDIMAVILGTKNDLDVSTTETTGPQGTVSRKTTTSSPSLGEGEVDSNNNSILSKRGHITVDDRTNQMIVQDTGKNLEKIRDLVKQLDIAVRQVLIESRIVIANNDFSRELGSRFAVNRTPRTNVPTHPETPTVGQSLGQTQWLNANGPGQSVTTNYNANNSMYANGDYLSDLAITGVAGPGGAVGFTLLKIGDYLLDLELSAAQREGRGEIVSNPRVITGDQQKAVIKQGVQIPYSSGASTGTPANVSFKDAVMELNVTPHITPDDYIRMQLIVKKDTPGQQVGNNIAIDKREINTTAQVANGETVVLGGVFEGTKSTSSDKVPFLGDLPGIGFMFRRNLSIDQKKELLIFITPKILKQDLSMH